MTHTHASQKVFQLFGSKSLQYLKHLFLLNLTTTMKLEVMSESKFIFPESLIALKNSFNRRVYVMLILGLMAVASLCLTGQQTVLTMSINNLRHCKEEDDKHQIKLR